MLFKQIPFAVLTVVKLLTIIQCQVEPNSFSVSMFQFDPNQLGLFEEPKKDVKLFKQPKSFKKSSVVAKKSITVTNDKKFSNKTSNFGLPEVVNNTVTQAQKKTTNKVPDKAKVLTNSTALSANLQNTTSYTRNKIQTNPGLERIALNKNPEPSDVEALAHMKNPMFDGTQSSQPNSNKTTNMTSANLVNSTKSTNELLFYKNKTSHPKDEGSKKTTSVKLTKTTEEQIPKPAIKVVNINATKISNTTLKGSNSTLKDGNLKANLTTANIKVNATELDNTTKGDDVSNKTANNRRHEVLSHFIPLMNVSKLDRNDTFQMGSRKHQKTVIYPSCYQCAKSSNYTQCVKKATIKKCNEGLNNICFSRSKLGVGGEITYEMGCSNHKTCGDAKAFPCRDGSKNCFTCCQFDRCNSSPHHSVFETDQIDLDELTKEPKVNSTATAVRSDLVVLITGVVLVVMYT